MKKIISFGFVFLFSFLFLSCGTRSTDVQISAPLRPKYAAQGYKKLYIADFIITGEQNVDRHVHINVNKEIKETLKASFKEKSGFEIEDLKIEFDKQREPKEILKDAVFWSSQEIPDKEKSIILAGIVDFSNQQKTGLVTERITNPRTGAQRDVTTARERLQLILGIDLYLLRAETGEKLFQETFREEEVYDDVSNVSLALFYDLFERMTPKIVGILVPYRVEGSRTLLEP